MDQFYQLMQYRVDLDKPLHTTMLGNLFAAGNSNAHKFLIKMYRGQKKLDATGEVVAKIVFEGFDSEFLANGQIENGDAAFLMPRHFYSLAGLFSLSIIVKNGDDEVTVFDACGTMSNRSAGSLIDPDDVLPNETALLSAARDAQIAAQAATEAAESVDQKVAEATSELTERVELLSEEILTKAPAINCEASGSMVSITDAAAQPAVELISRIEPVQAGSGDPSPDNVRAISGWDSVSVTNETTGQTLTAELPETVYSGTLDWVTGVLTITHGYMVFDGSKIDKYQVSSAGIPNVVTAKEYDTTTATKDMYSSHYAEFGQAGRDKSIRVLNRAIHIYDTRFTSKDVAVDLLDASPVQIIYPLTTPYTIQLTPQQLNLLKGVNNVWSTTGDTDLTYVADTKLYIEQQLAAIAAAALNN